MNSLNNVSWRTMFTILFVLIAVSALTHVMNHTPMTNIGFISWR